MASHSDGWRLFLEAVGAVTVSATIVLGSMGLVAVGCHVVAAAVRDWRNFMDRRWW